MAGAGVFAYSAAKFSLEGLSEALAGEIAPFGARVLIVEPGNFRTGLLCPSMGTAAPMDAYANTVGVTRSYFASEDGCQSGDPRKRRRRSLLLVCVVCGHEQPHGERHRATCPGCGATLNSFALYRDLRVGR